VKRLALLGLALSGTVLLGACTSTVVGSAQPVPGQGPVKKADDPCTLVTAAQATSLGLTTTPKAIKGDPDKIVPPSCHWEISDPAAPTNSLDVGWATDLSFSDYINGAQLMDTVTAGGLKWQRYANILGSSYCSLDIVLSPTSFVTVDSYNDSDDTKACDLGKAALPFIGSQLPGGAPAPAPSAPSSTAPSGPLATVDPCKLLTAAQVTQLNLTGPGQSMGGGTTKLAPGCEWKDTDGPQGVKALDVWVDPSTPATGWPGLDVEGQPFPSAGKNWTVFPVAGGLPGNCSATLAVTDKSSVMLTSGNLTDSTKMCDEVKAAIPLVTGNLPAS
jgi:hypothetical protein